MTGEVHGEEEEGQLLHHRDAAFMGQSEGQRFYFWGFFGCRGLSVQSRAGPLGCPPQTDQVFKVLKGRSKRYYAHTEHLMTCVVKGKLLTLDVACLSLACSTSSL